MTDAVSPAATPPAPNLPSVTTQGSKQTYLASHNRSARPLAGEEGVCCPLLKNPIPLSASALIFGPSGLIRQSPNSLHFRPMLKGKGLDKTLRKRIFLVGSENIRFSLAGVQKVIFFHLLAFLRR